MNRQIGAQLPGFAGAVLSATVGAIIAVPALVVFAATGALDRTGNVLAVVAGVLCPVVPTVADMFAFRRVPTKPFGIVASINPVAAPAVAVVALGEFPSAAECAGIGGIVVANIAATAPGSLLSGQGRGSDTV